MNVNYLKLGDNVEFMRSLPDNCIDLTVCSPPYDNIAGMGGMFDFDLVAVELFRVTKPNHVVVWIVGDQRSDNCKSGTTHRQAVKFMDDIGFNLHDTIIMRRNHTRMPYTNCHANVVETALILSKEKIRKPNILRDVPNVEAGRIHRSKSKKQFWQIDKYGRRTNCWYFPVGGVHTTWRTRACRC